MQATTITNCKWVFLLNFNKCVGPFRAILSRLRTIISKTQLSCKLNKEERRGRREGSLCVLLTIHHYTQHINRGNDTTATDSGGKKGISRSVIMAYFLNFLYIKEPKVHCPEGTSPTGLHHQAQQLVFLP